MIKAIKGDILTLPAGDGRLTVVCHQTNCRGVMGSGLARQVREQFPEVYTEYRKMCKSGTVSLGDVQYCEVGDNFIIANCFAQDGYGRDKRYTQYDKLAECLKKVHEAYPDAVIRIPYKMGCGSGGGSWGVVRELIAAEFIRQDDTVEVWHYFPLEEQREKVVEL